MKLNEKQRQFVEACISKIGKTTLTIDQVTEVAGDFYMKYPPQWLVKNHEFKVGKGIWKLPSDEDVSTVSHETETTSKIEKLPETETKQEAAYIVSSLTGDIIPQKDDTFIPFGDFTSIKSIIASRKFYPIFITGLSGNGKTFGVTQAAAEKKRELIRVNITIETDEDDLLGGYRLKDGQTVWQNGPVIEAMERGAILLLDEIDLASNKIMCLQPILEGSGVFVKKINKFVAPKNGFNVVATANTKGQGSEDGKFIGTNILNEAFLERFPITVEQEYPSVSVERKILDKVFASLDVEAGDFAERLVTWADIIRKTFYEGGIDEIIATRRLVHIANAFAIFGERKKAIEMCIARFDEDTKTSFIDLYSKVDAEVSEAMAKESEELMPGDNKGTDDTDDLTPF